MSLLQLNNNIVTRLKQLGATHFSVAKNFDHPHHHRISSIHFFSSDTLDSIGSLPEVAYFIPSLHIPEFGNLTGFNEISRRNALDINIKPIPPEELIHAANSF